jgi:hypothetical protein
MTLSIAQGNSYETELTLNYCLLNVKTWKSKQRELRAKHIALYLFELVHNWNGIKAKINLNTQLYKLILEICIVDQ